jgi:hypothetical protein
VLGKTPKADVSLMRPTLLLLRPLGGFLLGSFFGRFLGLCGFGHTYLLWFCLSEQEIFGEAAIKTRN